jgi:hypothetical protein
VRHLNQKKSESWWFYENELWLYVHSLFYVQKLHKNRVQNGPR